MPLIPIPDSELPEATRLIQEVFDEINATEQSVEGQTFFKKLTQPESLKERQSTKGTEIFWITPQNRTGADLNPRQEGKSGRQAGVLEIRQNHLGLFFIHQSFRGKGIGRHAIEQLALHFRKNKRPDYLTVNSSAFAVNIYKKLGFYETGDIFTGNGITSLPMRLEFEKPV